MQQTKMYPLGYTYSIPPHIVFVPWLWTHNSCWRCRLQTSLVRCHPKPCCKPTFALGWRWSQQIFISSSTPQTKQRDGEVIQSITLVEGHVHVEVLLLQGWRVPTGKTLPWSETVPTMEAFRGGRSQNSPTIVPLAFAATAQVCASNPSDPLTVLVAGTPPVFNHSHHFDHSMPHRRCPTAGDPVSVCSCRDTSGRLCA